MNTEITSIKHKKEELKTVKPYLLSFFGDIYDRGLLIFDSRISYLHELCTYEYPGIKQSTIEFFLIAVGRWAYTDKDKIRLSGDNIPLFLHLIGRVQKTKPKYSIDTNINDVNNRGEKKMSLSDRMISLAMAKMIHDDLNHFELVHRNAVTVMRYIKDHGFYDRFKRSKPFASEERLVIETFKKYMSKWGYYVSDHQRAGLYIGYICKCTDDQYEEFKSFLLDLDDTHYAVSI